MRISARLVAGLFAIALPAATLARQQAPPAPAPAPAGQPTPAQQPPGQPPPAPPDNQQPPVIRSGINYVRVDVIVSDKSGNPVLDLKQEDFTVSEDKKLQKIDSFTVVKLDEISQTETRPPIAIRNLYEEEREAARPDVRLFVILLDDYHVRRGADMASRKPLIDFIQNQLAPADMVALMYPLTPVTDLHFSRDRESLTGAIQRFEGRKFNYEPRNTFEEQIAYYPAATVERIRNQITMDALKGAAIRMAGLREGRKSIILVSEGFTSTLPSQLNDPVAARPGYANPNRGNAMALPPSDRERLANTSDLITDMRQVFTTLNRNNTSIYAVDPRGLAVFEYGINEGVGLEQDTIGLRESLDTLHVLATNTDGRAIVNRNDLAQGMKQIIRDSSAYYLLGYNSSEAPTDGKFHEIKVEVKRRGVDVRARKGYWAYTVADVARANAPPKAEAPSAVMEALSTLAAPARGRPAKFWVGLARGDSGVSHVQFVWEPGPTSTGERPEIPARVFLTATGPDGRQLFRERVPAASDPSVTTRGGTATFDSPPGHLQLRLVVEGERGQVLDSTVRELTVPDFTKVQVSMGTPQVYRARTVREMQTLRANPAALPMVDREFSRAERMLVRVAAYAPGGSEPTLKARLLNRAGGPMADLPVQVAPGRAAEIELSLSALAGGDYLLEVTASNDSSTAQELIAFRIGR